MVLPAVSLKEFRFHVEYPNHGSRVLTSPYTQHDWLRVISPEPLAVERVNEPVTQL